MDKIIPDALLHQLGSEAPAKAIAILRAEHQLDDVQTAELVSHTLATSALNAADTTPETAWAWLRVAEEIIAEVQISQSVLGQIAYAQARLYVQAGDLAAAEASIRQAQSLWLQSNDEASLQRSNLGLTQILTIQGRYQEASEVVQKVIQVYESELANGNTEPLLHLLGARRNLASLYRYQNQDGQALQELSIAERQTASWLQQIGTDSALVEALGVEQAHQNIAIALSAMALDRIDRAEDALESAVAVFTQHDDAVNQARCMGNLGELYLRIGRYGKALSAFNDAARLGEVGTHSDEIRMGQVGEYLLNRSFVYLALNLLPEAEFDLQKSVQIFLNQADGAPKAADEVDPVDTLAAGAAQAPLELSLALLALGQLYIGTDRFQEADNALGQASRFLDSLKNRYWQNRLVLVRATAAAKQQQWDEVATLVSTIERNSPDAKLDYSDLQMATSIMLLEVQRHLALGEIPLALERTNQLSALIRSAAEQTDTEKAWSQLQIWLLHAQGKIAQAQGNFAAARKQYQQAIERLEAQRSVLPVEEVRAAYLIDKTQIYTDLLLSYLDDSTIAEDSVAEALSLIERVRSRTLLERLVSTFDDDTLAAVKPSDAVEQGAVEQGAVEQGAVEQGAVEQGAVEQGAVEQGAEQAEVNRAAKQSQLRQELTWLYNQLLGSSGTRRGPFALTREIEHREQSLRELEWQVAPELAQFAPLSLKELQSALPDDQHVVLYHIANDEVMAILIERFSAKTVRHLCSHNDLVNAYRALRFQLGRVEVQSAGGARHKARLLSGIQDSLHTLYRLLLEPLVPFLPTQRVQFIPTGLLSLVPMHALWDGSRYIVESYECTYAPSISVAAHCKKRSKDEPFHTFAGIGITDESIPFAEAEIASCSQYFEESWTYIGNSAGIDQLKQAAFQADVLHIATHGLYRYDNPFFSSLKLADGWIDVREIYRLPLSARLVVLSACESGVGQIQQGDENVGIARGFLGSGAHSLIVSMWNVHDETASTLMAHTYSHLGRNGAEMNAICPERSASCELEIERKPNGVGQPLRPSAALRAAQLTMLEQEPHPYYWAAFIALG